MQLPIHKILRVALQSFGPPAPLGGFWRLSSILCCLSTTVKTGTAGQDDILTLLAAIIRHLSWLRASVAANHDLKFT
eukprot:2790582-Pleurochrysis_carterae.AAC.1